MPAIPTSNAEGDGAKMYDLVVLGGGSGGIATARKAASLGAKVALIEAGRLGGTCVNVGCVPKKITWNASALAGNITHDLKDYGFDVEFKGFDYKKMKTKRDAYVKKLNGIYESNLQKDGIELVKGVGRFDEKGVLSVEGKQLPAKYYLIAAGGRPKRPDIPEMVKSEPVRKAGILKASSADATQMHHLADVAARSRARPSIVNDDSTVQIPKKRRVSFSLSPGRIPEREKGTHVMRKQRSQETPEVTKRIPGGAEKKPQDKPTASVISKQYLHALQPVKGGGFAQPRERSASCDAKGLRCGSSTVRSEIDLASKSAEFLRSEKKWSRAGTAFMRLAVLYLKIGSKQEAANKYIDASVCFDNVDVKTSVECSGKAVEIQMELDEGALLCQQSTKQASQSTIPMPSYSDSSGDVWLDGNVTESVASSGNTVAEVEKFSLSTADGSSLDLKTEDAVTNWTSTQQQRRKSYGFSDICVRSEADWKPIQQRVCFTKSPEVPTACATQAEVLTNNSLMGNMHVGFPLPVGGENELFVREDYRYYHYGCDDIDDEGWGCGCRVLQTLSSWIDPAVAPLSLREMIVVVAEMAVHDTEKSNPGGSHIENSWIGTFEGFLIIDRVYDVSCRIDFVKSPRELGLHMSVVRNHFATVGSPIFMGGDQDCYGKCIVGACSVGPLEYLLVLDPHYSGFLDSREEAYRKGCLKWTAVNDFLEESFYNLLMPLSHGSLKYRPARCELYRSTGIARGTGSAPQQVRSNRPHAPVTGGLLRALHPPISPPVKVFFENLSVSERVGNVKNATRFSGNPSGTDNKEEMPITVITKGAIASGTDTSMTSRGHISRRFPEALPHPKRFELPPCDRTFLDVVYQVSALEPVSDGRFALLFYTYQNYSMMTKSQMSELVKWVMTSGAPISLLVQLVRPCGYAVRGYPARSVTDYVVLWIAGAFYYGSRGVAIRVAVRLEAYGVAKRMASQYPFRFRSHADALDAVQLWVWSDYHALLKLRRSSSKGRLNRLPCVNRYRGCSFLGSVEAGIQHGDVCPFRIFRHYPACGGCGARLRPDVSPEHVDTLSHLSVCEGRVALFTADGGNSKYYKRVPVPTASLLRLLQSGAPLYSGAP